MKQPFLHPVTVFATLSLLVTGGTLLGGRNDQEKPPPGQYLGVPAQRERIDQIIATLRAETFDESVTRLFTDDQSYFYPGYYSAKLLAQTNLEVMLSNRRTVKVLGEIERLPEGERGSKSVQLFDLVFKKHAEAIRTALRHTEDPAAPKNTQSVKATQLTLGAFLLATAQHGTTRDLLTLFTTLDDFREEIERRLVKNKSVYPDSLILATRGYCCPDNRSQLNVLCIHAARLGDGRLPEGVQKISSDYPKTKVPVVNWDAHTTWFDLPRRLEGIPLDTAKGVINYEFYEWPGKLFYDEDAQRRVLREIRKIVFPAR